MIPDVRQKTNHGCGAACVAALLSFHGLPVRRGLERLAHPAVGMGEDVVEALLWDAFDGRVMRGTLDVPLLRHLANAGRPTIALVTFEAGGHWVVVRGVARGRVYYHCPTNGPESRRIPDWLTTWTNGPPGAGGLHRFGICPDPR